MLCALFWWSVREGRFDGDRSLGGGGYASPVPPPPRRIVCRLPKTRLKNWLGLSVLNSVGARVMDVSMVIAAWGEGVGVLVSPSPLLDRSSCAKTRVKNAGWVPGHAPIRRARPCPRPPPRQNSKKTQKYDRNIEADLSLVFPTHVCNSTHPLVIWLAKQLIFGIL